jgi:hypothetical protein
MISTNSVSKANSYPLFKYFFILLCLIAALLPLIINAEHYIYDLLSQNTKSTASTFFYSALWGGIFIYLSTAKYKKIPIVITLISCLLILVLTVYQQQLELKFFTLTALASVISYSTCMICGTRDLIRKKITAQQTPLAYLFMPLFIILSAYALYLTIALAPSVDDQLLYATDATLGFYPTFFMGKLFAVLSLWPQIIIYIIYATLPFAWAVVYLNCYRTLKAEPASLIKEVLITALLGTAAYLIIPAYGPLNLLGSSWPWHTISALAHPSAIISNVIYPRNCMPSLHVVVAYLIWRHAQVSKPPMRIIFTLWLFILVLSTLMLGQHYLIDVIVAFPFVTFIRGICATSFPPTAAPRLQAILVGAGLCCAWFLLISFGLPLLRLSPIIPWILYTGTIFVACISEYRLAVNKSTFHLLASNRLAMNKL